MIDFAPLWRCFFERFLADFCGELTGRKRVLETGVWLKLWQNHARLSQPFPSPSPFSPFFLPLFSFLSHSG